MRKKTLYFLGIFEVIILCSIATTQDLNDATNFENEEATKFEPARSKTTPTDSISSKLSVVPIFAFGFSGMILGGVIGNLIDPQGKAPGGDEPVFWSKGTVIGIGAGAVSGACIGYLLAKRDTERNQMETQKTKRQK